MFYKNVLYYNWSSKISDDLFVQSGDMIRRNMGCRCRKQAKTLNKLGWCFTLSVSGLLVSEG